MQTEYRREIRFDEIIIELDHEHIYGYTNGEAVEIIEPHAFNFSTALDYTRRRINRDSQWIRSHKSELEERYVKVGESND